MLTCPIVRVLGMAVALVTAPLQVAAQGRSGESTPPAVVTIVAGADVPDSWTYQVRAALREVDGVRLRLLPRPSATARRDVRDSVVGAVARVERAFRSADFAACVASAEDAAQELGPLLAEAGQLRQIAPVWTLAAACELKRRAVEAARARAALVLAIDPDVRIDRYSQSPDVVRLFDEMRREIASRPRVRLTLRSNVPDARLEVDGRPIEGGAVDVIAGPHLVVGRALGARTAVREVVVGEATETTVLLEPADAQEARAQTATETRPGSAPAGVVRAAAMASGARLVVRLDAVPRGKLEITLWQVVGLEASRLGSAIERPPDGDSWRELVGNVHPMLRARRASASSGVPWWAWVAGGAVLVGAGVVIAVLAQPEDQVQLKSALYCDATAGEESCRDVSELFE